MDGCKVTATQLAVIEKLQKNDGSKNFDASFYRSLIDNLMYLMDAVGLLSRFMQELSLIHPRVAKRVLRYLKRTLDYGTIYSTTKDTKFAGFSDSDWAGNLDDMKSTPSNLFSIGSGACSWQSKKQKVVALSSAEAEYI